MFYETYRSWAEEKRDYVARFMAEEYAADKEGTRELLYGPWPARYAPPEEKKKSKPKRRRKESSARRDLPQNRGNRPYKRKGKDYQNPWGEPLIKDGNYYVRQRKRHRRDRDDDD